MNSNFKLRIIRVMALTLFCTAMATMSGCFLFGGDDGPCGSLSGGSILLDKDRDPNFVEQANSFIKNGDRVFKFNLGFQKNVCPDKHIQADAFVNISKQPPLQTIIAEGVVEWGFLFEQRFPLDEKREFSTFDEIYGDTEPDGVGLKQAFGKDRASYNVAVEIRFNTFGDEARDRQFFMENIEAVSIGTTYWQFKGQTNSSTNNPLGSG